MRKLSCLLYGEGGSDEKILKLIVNISQFQYHNSNWVFSTDHAFGGGVRNVLNKCRIKMAGASYDLTICFVDLDVLKKDCRKWQKEKAKIEKEYSDIVIFWQDSDLEDEMCRNLNIESQSKHSIQRLAKKKIKQIVNSEYWKRLLKIIKNYEETCKD